MESDNYLIIDITANTNRIYIDTNGDNCELEENAMVFATEKDANEKIKDYNWGGWATVMETDYPINQ